MVEDIDCVRCIFVYFLKVCDSNTPSIDFDLVYFFHCSLKVSRMTEAYSYYWQSGMESFGETSSTIIYPYSKMQVYDMGAKDVNTLTAG